MGSRQCVPADVRRVRVRVGVRCRAEVQGDEALSGGADHDESDPFLHWRARARDAEVVLTRLTRSQLFVPASKPAMIKKAAASAADAICIDLEDSVTPAEKASSRANVVHALKEIDFGRRVRMFRINALDTPFAYRDLVEVVEAAGDRLDAVMIPKAGSARDIEFVDTLLTQIEAHTRLTRQIGLEAQIETASGFLHA